MDEQASRRHYRDVQCEERNMRRLVKERGGENHDRPVRFVSL